MSISFNYGCSVEFPVCLDAGAYRIVLEEAGTSRVRRAGCQSGRPSLRSQIVILKIRQLEELARIKAELALLQRAPDAHVRLVGEVDDFARKHELAGVIEQHHHPGFETLRDVLANNYAELT